MIDKKNNNINEPLETPSDVLFKDPLSSITRKERKYLLIVSFMCIAIVKMNFFPSKISVLGIEFTSSDKQAQVWILLAIVIYFFLSFLIFATQDFIKWRLQYIGSFSFPEFEDTDENENETEYLTDEQKKEVRKYFERYTKNRILFYGRTFTSIIRSFWDFLFPLIICTYSIISLISYEV